MSAKPREGLAEQIEQLVRTHLAAQQRAMTAAVQRAFASEAAPRPAISVRKSSQRRRCAREMSELQERLYQAVVAHPGETMTTIAADVGQPPPALNRAMVQLKREGRVRSAGQRNLTRYFPMLATKSS